MELSIQGLWRYPVKTLAGEPLVSATLTTAGIPSDRIVHVPGPEGVRTSGATIICSDFADRFGHRATRR